MSRGANKKTHKCEKYAYTGPHIVLAVPLPHRHLTSSKGDRKISGRSAMGSKSHNRCGMRRHTKPSRVRPGTAGGVQQPQTQMVQRRIERTRECRHKRLRGILDTACGKQPTLCYCKQDLVWTTHCHAPGPPIPSPHNRKKIPPQASYFRVNTRVLSQTAEKNRSHGRSLPSAEPTV